MSTKKYIATKIYAEGCTICEHMSRIDRPTFEGFPEVGYQELDLDDVINNEGNPTKVRLYSIIEKYAVNNDYTVDTPLYVIMTMQGKYLGHHTGEATITQLRECVNKILSQESG
jgi:hypothetical protein